MKTESPLALLAILAIFVVPQKASAAAPALPSLNIADLASADLDSAEAWSAVQNDGGVRCRAALKDQDATFLVNAWWDEKRLHPPEKTVYVLEVQYKDTVHAPVVVTAHGALGPHFTPTEVHRLGGAGDGRWKVAAIPFAWDQIIRLLNHDPKRERYAKTAFGFQRPDADLPIGSLSIRLATAEDESRYNAETRAWVARVQADLRQKNPPPLRPRAFCQGRELPPVVAFAWPAMATLLPEAQPDDAQVGAPVKIRACINQMEPGSLGVYANGADLTGLDYKVEHLVDAEGREFVGKIIHRTAEYSMARSDKRAWLCPMRFWPAYKTTVPRGQSQWLLFNVQTVRGLTRPGVYKGAVAITCDQGAARLPVELHVLAVDLPSMTEAGLTSGGCIGARPPLHDVEFQVSYNQNSTSSFPGGFEPYVERKDGKLVFDFRYMDDWLAGAKQAGCVNIVYFFGGDPYGFPHTMSILRELASLGKDGDAQVEWSKKQCAHPEAILPEDRAVYQEWVKAMAAHSRAAGWPEWIVSPFDEPAKWPQNRKQPVPGKFVVSGAGPYIKPMFKDSCAAIRQADPTLRIYASIHHNYWEGQFGVGECFLPDCNVFCTNAIHEDLKLGDKARAAHKDFWEYGFADSAAPPDRSRYMWGFFFGSFDARGSLVWAYNRGAGGWDVSQPGEHCSYAWQTPFDTIPGPWFEGYRVGWDDRRVIEVFKKKFAGNAEKMKALDDVVAAVRAKTQRRKSGSPRDTESDIRNAMAEIARLDVWRGKLLDELENAK